MMEPDFSLLAIAVVGIGLTFLAFFVREGIVTSNIYKQGVKFYQSKDYKAAEAAFRQVVSRHPSNDVVRLLLGDTLMQLQKLDEAIAYFQELLDRAPNNVDAHLRLSTALLKQDKLDEAISALETARDLFKAQRDIPKAESVEQLLQQIKTQSLT